MFEDPNCPHTLQQREHACDDSYDGLCPLCLHAKVAELERERDGLQAVVEIANRAATGAELRAEQAAFTLNEERAEHAKACDWWQATAKGLGLRAEKAERERDEALAERDQSKIQGNVATQYRLARERNEAIERAERAEAQCAAMRGALEAVVDTHLMGHDTEACELSAEYGECDDCELVPKVNAALSSDAGRAMSGRVERMEQALDTLANTHGDERVFRFIARAALAKGEE